MSAIALVAESGAERPAEGTLVRQSDGARVGRAIALALGGFAGAMVCVVIPGVHLITTWLLPLLGLVAARQALRTRARIEGLRGQCPACNAAIELEGGRVTEPMFEPCPACHRNLRVALR